MMSFHSESLSTFLSSFKEISDEQNRRLKLYCGFECFLTFCFEAKMKFLLGCKYYFLSNLKIFEELSCDEEDHCANVIHQLCNIIIIQTPDDSNAVVLQSTQFPS